MMESVIGKVTHYFSRAVVAVVILDESLTTGETIRIRGPHDDFCQAVNSMEIDHQRITEAVKGQDISIKVIHRVHEGDIVYHKTCPSKKRHTNTCRIRAGGPLFATEKTMHVTPKRSFR